MANNDKPDWEIGLGSAIAISLVGFPLMMIILMFLFSLGR